jgi:uncharacterized membrane protein
VNAAGAPGSAAANAGRALPSPELVRYTHWIYGLHALAVVTGVLTSSSITGRFLLGLPSIIAVIMNYARRSDAEGTWLGSHFHWQIRTFWFALLWATITLVVSAPLLLVVVGIYVAMAGLGLVGLWVAYRVVRGWLALRDGRGMPLGGTPVGA